MFVRRNSIGMLANLILAWMCVFVLVTLFCNRWNDSYIPKDGMSQYYEDLVLNNSEEDSASDFIAKLEKQFNSFRIQKQNNKGYTPIYLKNMKMGLDLSEGREFTDEDFQKHSDVALVSENYLDDIYEQDGKKYIAINNDIYEVVGVFKMHTNAVNNNSEIFISMNAINYLNSNEEIGGRYYLDSYDKISDTDLNDYDISFNDTIFQMSLKERLELVKDTMAISYKVYIIAVCALVCNIMLMHALWLISKAKTIWIFYICGGTTKMIAHNAFEAWCKITAITGIPAIIYTIIALDCKKYLLLCGIMLMGYLAICAMSIHVYINKKIQTRGF
ncbi:MAG: ABC transporter permease [Lachnospiraceae bacterium]|nr:ABC transporter permease [Lachnospiraceae bacterium]